MSKFSDKEFILLNRAKDLYIYTSEAVGNEKVIPRRRRYPTGQRLETMAMEILQKCHLANTTDLHRAFEERQRLQTEVIALCLTLEQLIDALKASKAYPGINQHKADIWIQHSLDVDNTSPPAGGTYGVKHALFLLGRLGNPQATAPACRRSCRDATGSSTGISTETRTGGNHTKTHP